MNQLRIKTFSEHYGIDHGGRECPVCVSRGVRGMRHRHFSSLYHQQRCIAAGETRMNCAICQDRHDVVLATEESTKVIISSSTLNGFWQAEEWTGTEKYHIVFEAVGGLKLAGAKRLWKAMFDNVPRPVDCHLCVGLNDVIHLARTPPRLQA